MARTSHARADIIAAATDLISARGYEGVGMAELIAASGAPRGSLYFHFPGGKEQIGVEVVESAAARVTGQYQKLGASRLDLDGYIDRVFKETARLARACCFSHSCPIAAVATEVSERTPGLRAAVKQALKSWAEEIEVGVKARGLNEANAAIFASAMVALTEGALIASKGLDSDEPHKSAAIAMKALAASLRQSQNEAPPNQT